MTFRDGTKGDPIRVRAMFTNGDERWTLREGRPGWSVDGIVFDYTEGDFSCDCNRSDGELPCGDEIKLKSLWIDGIRQELE